MSSIYFYQKNLVNMLLRNAIRLECVCKHAVSISTETPDPSLLDEQYLNNISLEIIGKYCKEVSFFSLNHNWRGICVENNNGGFEYFNSSLSQNPITIGKKGITVINYNKKFSRCLLFYNFLDFLNYKTKAVQKKHSHSIDSIILNDPSNLCDFIKHISLYKNVNCLFPPSSAGKTLTKTIYDIHKNKVDN